MSYTTRELRFMNNSKIAIRDININYLTGDSDNIIEEFFNYIWSDLYVIEVNVYYKNKKEILFYNSERDYIFFLHADDLSVASFHTELYWNILADLTGLTFTEIQAVTADYFYKRFGLRLKPRHTLSSIMNSIDIALENNIDKPLVRIEDYLNNKPQLTM